MLPLEASAVNPSTDATVHVVDDDNAVRDSLKTLLESYGFDVRDYRSAVEFLNATGALDEGCLLLDLHLPVVSGLDLLTVMQEREMRLPVIFMTGRSDRETKERALQKGAVAFLDKPLGERSLMAAIYSALNRTSGAERREAPALELAAAS
jgi:two-component system response regulator FixJ